MVVVAAEHEDDASGPLFVHHLDTCSNQLKTSGRSRPLAIRPSTSPIGSIARLSPTARRIDWPGTTTRESPATQTRSGRAGVNFSRAGARRSRVGHGLRHRDTRVDLVVLRAPENRLDPSSRLVEEERSADRRERLGGGQSDVTLPAFRLDFRRLPQPLGVQERPHEEGEKRDGDRGACRVQPPALFVDASAGMSSPVSASELEVDERGHALRSHRMRGEERDGEDDRLRRHREA